jgi:hypothetical protein
MNFPTIGDVKHVTANLTPMERHELILASRRMQQIRDLGERYVAHPSNAPARGTYHPSTGVRLG